MCGSLINAVPVCKQETSVVNGSAVKVCWLIRLREAGRQQGPPNRGVIIKCRDAHRPDHEHRDAAIRARAAGTVETAQQCCRERLAWLRTPLPARKAERLMETCASLRDALRHSADSRDARSISRRNGRRALRQPRRARPERRRAAQSPATTNHTAAITAIARCAPRAAPLCRAVRAAGRGAHGQVVRDSPWMSPRRGSARLGRMGPARRSDGLPSACVRRHARRTRPRCGSASSTGACDHVVCCCGPDHPGRARVLRAELVRLTVDFPAAAASGCGAARSPDEFTGVAASATRVCCCACRVPAR